MSDRLRLPNSCQPIVLMVELQEESGRKAGQEKRGKAGGKRGRGKAGQTDRVSETNCPTVEARWANVSFGAVVL
jgi:hypothetical protein